MKRLLILLLVYLSLFSGIAQNADIYLSSFFGVEQNGSIYLRWTIKAGNTCEGTRIERSEDGLNFLRIGEISGVCGSPDQPVGYEFFDISPIKGKTNFYRLEMGALGLSSTVNVDYILYNSDNYSLQPNPVVNESKLYFKNPLNKDYSIFIYDQLGKQISHIVSSNDFIIIRKEDFPSSAVYIFLIQDQSGFTTSGKIVVI